jgi:polar amino acid transport system substrate-binding protein
MGSLTIPGVTIDPMVENAEIVTYDTDTTALEDLVLGDGVRLDAVLTALPVGQGYIEDGRPIKQLGSAVYYEYLAAAVDRHSSEDVTAFVDRLNEIIQEMHADGTLLALSQEFYGLDYTSAAAEFDLANLGQE